MPDELTDAQLVDLLRADRTAGFDLLYRRYAQRLFAYSVTVVQDRAAAEDATHESLMAAVAKIDKLRNPEQLRPWLFAITRNRCLTLLGDRKRFTDNADGLDMIPVDDDPTVGLARHESAALVTEALAGLAPADRDTLALALRHDLDAADVALAMGSNQPTARARISRAKAALTGSVTALLLARDATDPTAPACDGLQQALAGFTGEWTPLIRKRVAKHVKSCAQCDERGHKRAVAYVSGFSLPVVLVLGPQFRARADEGVAALDVGAADDSLTWGSDGFPESVEHHSRRLGRGLAMAGVAGVALLLTALVAWQVNAEPPPVEPAVAPVTTSASPIPSATPSPQTAAVKKQSPSPEKDTKTSQGTDGNASTGQPTSEPRPDQSKTPDERDEPTKDPRTSDSEPTRNTEPTKNTEPTEETEPTKEPAPDPPKDPDPVTAPEPEPQPVEPEPKPDRPVTHPDVKDAAPSPDAPAAGQ